MRCTLAAVAVLGLAVATSARCEIVTRQVDFNLTHTVPGFSDLVGSFTLTFDRSQDYTDATAGLTFSDFSIPGVPSGYTYATGGDSLVVGGLINGVNSVISDTVDYLIVLTGFTGNTPSFLFAALANNTNLDTGFTGTLRVTDPLDITCAGAGNGSHSGPGLAALAGLRRRQPA